MSAQVAVGVENYPNGNNIFGFLINKDPREPLKIALLNTHWGDIIYIFGVSDEIRDRMTCNRFYAFLFPDVSLEEIAAKTRSRNRACMDTRLTLITDIGTGERIELNHQVATAA